MDAYISQQKNQLLDSLENQVRFSQLVAVIVGEKGIGKSFVLHQLQKRLEKEVAIASIDASLSLDVPQLEKTISLQLGLSWQGAETHLEKKIKKDLSQKVLITIDNSHLLSKDCIDFILKLNQSQLSFQESILFILLSGEGNLPALISKTDTYLQCQDMCVVFQIEPIKKSEIQSVVEGFGNINTELLDELYENKKLEYFWQLSKGNPAELNYHLLRWLEEHTSEKELDISRSETSSYLKSVFYVFIVLILILALFFQNEINLWITPKAENIIVDSTNENVSLNENILSESSVYEEKLATNNTSNAKEKVTNNPNKQPNNHKVEGLLVNQPKQKNLKEENEVQKRIEKKKEAVLGVSNNTIKKESQPPLNKMKFIGGKLKNEEILTNSDVTTEKDINTKTSNNLTVDEQSLLIRDSDYYVLQWTGLSLLSAAENYKKAHPLNKKLSIYRRKNGDKILYLVVSDYFPTKRQADLGKADYLKQSLADKPWVKSMRAVQSEIKAFQSAQASGKIR